MAVCLVNLRPVAFVNAVFTVACFVLSGLTVFAQPNVSASCAALMVAETGELIYGKNEHDRRSMASTTKINDFTSRNRSADSAEKDNRQR